MYGKLYVRSVAFTLIILLAACHKTPEAPVPVRSVSTLTVETSAATHVLDLAGSVYSRTESPLGFQIGGIVLSRAVHLGQTVHTGQILATIDPRDLELSLASAQAALDAAKANWILALDDLHRINHLRGSNFASAEEQEHRKLTADAAKAQLDEANNTLSLRHNQLEYAVLHAPASGVITKVSAEPGQVVAAGEPIVQLARKDGLDIGVVVPEDDLELLHQTHASVSFWANPNEIIPVQLREFSASADPVTRTYAVRYAYVSRHYTPALGQSAVIHLDLNHAIPSLLIPSTALVYNAGSTGVWVYQPTHSTVHLQTIHVLDAVGTLVSIDGISPGTVIVSQGVHVLVDGEKVQALPSADHPPIKD